MSLLLCAEDRDSSVRTGPDLGALQGTRQASSKEYQGLETKEISYIVIVLSFTEHVHTMYVTVYVVLQCTV